MHHKLSFYKHAAELLKLAKNDNKNVKQILYTEKKYKFMNIKALYALVSEVLKHWEVLEIIIKESNILTDHPGYNPWHVKVLVTELIFGKKELNTDRPIENTFIETILQYEETLRNLTSKKKIQNLLKVIETSNLNVDGKVRYIKINTLKIDVETVINGFIDEGWQKLPTPDDYKDFIDQLKTLNHDNQAFLEDYHIPEVLAFPPGTEFYAHDLYKNGSFFLMDKSSCLAPFLLRPRSDSVVLDMCAAPGLKTIQLAGIVNTGKIYAVERDCERYKVLQEFVVKSGADNVETICSDVTQIDVEKYKDVKYILLDPSCSGSGIRDRQPSQGFAPEDEKDRLKKLASFQLTLLRFALTRFPSVKRVVYSTCSLNIEENEEVVSDALFSKYHNFEVVEVHGKLPGWLNFGNNEFPVGSKCIYCLPESDLTTGFFLAVFQRKKSKQKVDLEVGNGEQDQSNTRSQNNNKQSFKIDQQKSVSRSDNFQTNTSTFLKNKKRKTEESFEKEHGKISNLTKLVQDEPKAKRHRNTNQEPTLKESIEYKKDSSEHFQNFNPKQITNSQKKRMRRKKIKANKSKDNFKRPKPLKTTQGKKEKSKDLLGDKKEDKKIHGTQISKAKIRRQRLKKLKELKGIAKQKLTNG